MGSTGAAAAVVLTRKGRRRDDILPFSLCSTGIKFSAPAKLRAKLGAKLGAELGGFARLGSFGSSISIY